MISEEALVGAAHEALRQWRGREIFPTDLSSAMLRGLAREVRERAVFSARTTSAAYVAELARAVDGMLEGRISMADGRLMLYRKLRELGYTAAGGFPQDQAGDVPPAEEGSLQDLSSRERMRLVLETNQRLAANYGRMVAGNEDYALYAYPAWELVRVFAREVPRGSAESQSPGWGPRWRDAGEAVGWAGALDGGPMVARKDSPLWQALGDGAGGYRDTMGNPYPPYAFGSGMGWQAVPRARCIELGLVGEDEASGPMSGELTPDERHVNEAWDRLPPDVREQVRRELAQSPEQELLRREAEAHQAAMDARVREGIERREEIREAGRRMLEGLMT